VKGTFSAEVIKRDETNDLALLKIQGQYTPLYIAGSGGLRAGDRIITVGFPNPTIQGLTPKFSSGDVAALSGPADDPRLLQISLPVQPGNSGGPLVNRNGEAVGVVVGRLDKLKILRITGSIPENVNYAIKGTHLIALLESVPGLVDRMPQQPKVVPVDQAAMVSNVEQSCGLVLIRK
jgi:S1-C subfamily serine protease